MSASDGWRVSSMVPSRTGNGRTVRIDNWRNLRLAVVSTPQ